MGAHSSFKTPLPFPARSRDGRPHSARVRALLPADEESSAGRDGEAEVGYINRITEQCTLPKTL